MPGPLARHRSLSHHDFSVVADDRVTRPIRKPTLPRTVLAVTLLRKSKISVTIPRK